MKNGVHTQISGEGNLHLYSITVIYEKLNLGTDTREKIL